MQKHIVLLFLVWECISIRSIAQNAQIVFRTDQNITIMVNKPIDGYYNYYAVSDKLKLKPNMDITYTIDLIDFGFIFCNYPSDQKLKLLLLAGDKVILEYKNGKVSIEGNNADGNKYFNDNYVIKGLGAHYAEIQPVFASYMDRNIDPDEINKKIEDFVNTAYRKDIETLNINMKITTNFGKILSKDLDYAYRDIVYVIYENLLRGDQSILRRRITSTEIETIMNEYNNSIYDPQIINVNTLKYDFGNIFTDYYILKYHKLDSESKDNLMKGYDKNIFGAYPAFLLAPKYMYPKLFGDKLIEQLKYSYNYFDADLMFTFLKTNFPRSEYIPIIAQMMKAEKNETSNSGKADVVIINTEQIISLEDLLSINGIKDNYVYIDLWATWCMPCLREFQYHEEIEHLLGKYKNLVKAYISIDGDDMDERWRKQVEKFNLSGYNLRASKSLQQEIIQKVYNGSSLSIPRYLLLDTNGTIIHDNLPRPSNLKMLEQILDEKVCK